MVLMSVCRQRSKGEAGTDDGLHSTSVHDLYSATAAVPLRVTSYSTTSRRLCAIAFEKTKLMPDDHPRRVALDGTTAHRLGRNSWRKLSQEIMDMMPEELSSRDIQ